MNGQQKRLQWGAVTGLNISNYNYYYNEIIAPGLRAGGIVQFNFHPNLSLQGELLLSAQNLWYKTGADKFCIKHNLLYLKMPVSIKYYPRQKGFNLFAGAYISCFLGANSSNGYFPENTREMDLGTILGLGYDFPFGLFFNVRWEQSCINNFTSPWSKAGGYNTTGAFSCGWLFK